MATLAETPHRILGEKGRNDALSAFHVPWSEIAHPDTFLVVEPRKGQTLSAAAAPLLKVEPFSRIASGSVRDAVAQLGDLPHLLVEDIAKLASRFSAISGSEHVRIRIEQIATNACSKVHADFTDLRLITTYAGPGTQVALDNDRDADRLMEIPTGHVGLFKGRRFAAGHEPCYHRSPPAGDIGIKRLVLVMDAETFPSESECG